MEALLYCCCGLDVHKNLIEACILRGEGLEPDALRESLDGEHRGRFYVSPVRHIVPSSVCEGMKQNTENRPLCSPTAAFPIFLTTGV